MAKYCPSWVFDCIVAQCTVDVIKLGYGLDLICKKYADGLRNTYDDISTKELKATTNIFLKLLSDYNINQNSVRFLQNFIYFRFVYINRYMKRNFKSIFSNPFTSRTKRDPENEESLAYIQTFLFEWRSTANLKITKGWSLASQKQFKELAKLVKKPLSEQETKMLLRETKKNEFLETWTKK
tara:strand:+ start:153 stop:698 length:546 start_codon:yes stop_codon:yes gene_type:complete